MYGVSRGLFSSSLMEKRRAADGAFFCPAEKLNLSNPIDKIGHSRRSIIVHTVRQEERPVPQHIIIPIGIYSITAPHWPTNSHKLDAPFRTFPTMIIIINFHTLIIYSIHAPTNSYFISLFIYSVGFGNCAVCSTFRRRVTALPSLWAVLYVRADSWALSVLLYHYIGRLVVRVQSPAASSLGARESEG